jgi:hypothetical protein
MMSTIAKHPDITPIPVQLSEPEFNEFIFPVGSKNSSSLHFRFTDVASPPLPRA